MVVRTNYRGYGGSLTGSCRGVHYSASEYYIPVHYDVSDLRYLYEERYYHAINRADTIVLECGDWFFGITDNVIGIGIGEGDG